MSLVSHIGQLEQKHCALEKELHSARIHPSTDSIELNRIKSLKLRLKDEIARLRMRLVA